MKTHRVDAAIVGAGPAGLAAALELRHLGVEKVLVLEREAEAGGVPRHCHHTGFGWFDLRRILSGPGYARTREGRARDAGVEILTNTTALSWGDGTSLNASGPEGLLTIEAKAVLLATGCRERPRSARLVPGDRPAGVLTTGALQQLVYLKRAKVGTRAVIVGAEHVSYSAVQTLWHGGLAVAALVTDLPASQTYWPVHAYVSGVRRVPLLTGATVSRIIGHRRVEAVEVTTAAGPRTIPCDTVVFTGDWIPDYELARHGGLALDAGTRGPAVDAHLATSRPGVFAAGNAVHAAEMADFAALGGVAAARCVQEFLRKGPAPRAGIPLQVASPVKWIYPNLMTPGLRPPLGRYLLRVDSIHERASLAFTQGTKTLHVTRRGRLVANRSLHVPAGIEDLAVPGAGAVTVSLV